VELEGGESLGADMVLISAGVRPELTLAKSVGLEIDKGVKVVVRWSHGRPPARVVSIRFL
jgi:NAD(P)H-nitrite reductase large subunit